MEATSIAPVIKRFILEEIAEEPDVTLDDGESLLEGGILDSFGIMSLLSFVETEFRVTVPAEEIEPSNFETLAAIAALVANHL